MASTLQIIGQRKKIVKVIKYITDNNSEGEIPRFSVYKNNNKEEISWQKKKKS